MSDPLLGFGPPTRYAPKPPPVASRPTGTSLGVYCPSSASGGRSPRPARPKPDEPPGFWPGIAPAGPTPPATVPLTGFLNLAAASFSLRPPAIFRQVALLGFHPSGVCSTHADPTTHRRRHALLTFLPLAGLPPDLGGGTSGRAGRLLGSRTSTIHRLQGLNPHESRSLPPVHG